MKNEHLVPVNIVDLVNKLQDKTLHENERTNYIHRIEAIRDYCNAAVNKYNTARPINKSNTRVMR